uniref:Uncharacterized protein n=1 Tax=Arundo donax TaxID=35708 RepID=A0A0A9H9U1_ARUDO
MISCIRYRNCAYIIVTKILIEDGSNYVLMILPIFPLLIN